MATAFLTTRSAFDSEKGIWAVFKRWRRIRNGKFFRGEMAAISQLITRAAYGIKGEIRAAFKWRGGL